MREIKVKLSQDDKENIFNAFINHESTQLILKSDALSGNDTLLVPHKMVKTGEVGYVLDEKIFHEMYNNGYFIIIHFMENFSCSLLQRFLKIWNKLVKIIKELLLI